MDQQETRGCSESESVLTCEKMIEKEEIGKIKLWKNKAGCKNFVYHEKGHNFYSVEGQYILTSKAFTSCAFNECSFP